MYYLLWALKNIRKNLKRTVTTVLFIGIISSITLLIYGFAEGSKNQLKMAVRADSGDIIIRSFNAYNIFGNVDRNVLNDYKNEMSDIMKELELDNCSFNTPNIVLQSILAGVESKYFKRNNNYIKWITGRALSDDSNEANIEYSYSQKLGIKQNDSVLVEYTTKHGVINTVRLKVVGIFAGNQYLQGSKMYTSINAARDLSLEKDNYNIMKIYFKDIRKIKLRKVKGQLEKIRNIYLKIQGISNGNENNIETVFENVWIIIGIMLNLVVFIILIILFFGIYNSFSLSLFSRTREISTLLTFGMKNSRIYSIVLYENIIIVIGGYLIGALITLTINLFLRNIVSNNEMSQLVTVTGGPYIRFDFSANVMTVVLLIMVITSMFASLKCLREFFKVGIRGIMNLNK